MLKEEQLEDPYLAVEEEDEKTPNVFSSDWLPPKKDKTYTSNLLFHIFLNILLDHCLLAIKQHTESENEYFHRLN